MKHCRARLGMTTGSLSDEGMGRTRRAWGSHLVYGSCELIGLIIIGLLALNVIFWILEVVLGAQSVVIEQAMQRYLRLYGKYMRLMQAEKQNTADGTEAQAQAP